MRFSPQIRQPFMGLALCATLGIISADRWAIDPLPLIVILCFTPVLFIWRSTIATLIFVGCSFVLLHTFNHRENAARHLADELSSKYQLVHIVGVVNDKPESIAGSSIIPESRFPVKLEMINPDGEFRFCDAKIMVKWSGHPPSYGDRISLKGNARNISPPRNPSQFNYSGYIQRLGVFSEIRMRYPADGHVLSSGHGNWIQGFAYKTRAWMQNKLQLDLEDSPHIAGLIQSMVLGLKGETPEEIREMFQVTGTLHLFAVSGLNVAMLAFIGWFLLKPIGIGRKCAVFLIVPLLCFYAVITGLGASSVRATIMAAIVMIAYLFDRKPLLYNNLAAAAFLILAWDTNQLFTPGFQFSFGLVLTIIFLAPRLQKVFEKFGKPDSFLPRSLWSPF